jgi:hypothetical protein
MKTCSIWWCDNKYYAKGFCHTHWLASRRYGSPYGKNPKHDLQAEVMLSKANRIAQFILEGYLKMDARDGCPLCGSTSEDTHNKDCVILDAYLIIRFKEKNGKEN